MDTDHQSPVSEADQQAVEQLLDSVELEHEVKVMLEMEDGEWWWCR